MKNARFFRDRAFLFWLRHEAAGFIASGSDFSDTFLYLEEQPKQPESSDRFARCF
jgi:hypothetical protein